MEVGGLGRSSGARCPAAPLGVLELRLRPRSRGVGFGGKRPLARTYSAPFEIFIDAVKVHGRAG